MGITVIAVFAGPSWPGLALSELAETSPLSEVETADFYVAMFKDVCTAAERSGGGLLVSYRAEDEFPDEFAGDHDSEAEIRSIVADTLGSTDNARFEPQVGSMFSARAGNTISHLLNEKEEVHLAAVVRPIAPLFGRTHLDSTATKSRSALVVFGPSTEGHVYFSGFLDPIDFTDVYVEPEVETLARRADDASHGLDYVPMLPALETGTNLATVMPMLWSRVESERLVPEHTMTFAFEEGFWVEPTDGMLELVRD